MKSTMVKSALALAVLGFTFGSNIVYESQWAPSIFRTIANAVESTPLTEENIKMKLSAFKDSVIKFKKSILPIENKINDKETGLSALLEIRDEDEGMTALSQQSELLENKVQDFQDFFKDKSKHELKDEFDALIEESPISSYDLAPLIEKLTASIDQVKEREILEQKAAIAATSEKICKNTGLLESIKAQIAKLLKDKEDVVQVVQSEEEKGEDKEEVKPGFSADVKTFADFMAQMRLNQRPMFSMTPPSLLAGSNNSMSMLMMMSFMNNRQFTSPIFQNNSYYTNNNSFSFPGPSDFSPSVTQRNPANSFSEFNRDDYTLKIPSVKRSNGLKGSFTF